MRLLVGPPGSGRTTRMVEVARRALGAGQLAWWVGLPAQRASILRRVTDDGYTALGLEVMSSQQMYYRLLARSGELRPLVTGNGRLVRVAEALRQVSGALPTPGEARLFSYAIAEAKRHALGPVELAAYLADRGGGGEAEVERLLSVFTAYQAALAGSRDYDDVRANALALVESDPEACEAEVIVVDGLREVGPLELRILKALSRAREVHLTLPAAPPGEVASETLPPLIGAPPLRYLAPNPVAELRWVLRSLKRDLAESGLDPLELALIVPPARVPAVLALAEEYGLPLMDETPASLADTAEGKLLLDLIELATQPTPSRLLAVPELAELARAALALGVSGADAIQALARELGLQLPWLNWQRRLTVSGDSVAWAESIVAEVLPLCGARLSPALAGRVLIAAQEAARLGGDAGFQAWWAALIRDTRSLRREPGGVALLTATLASGRRFRKAYLLGAVEGVYGAAESEDYFITEEERLALAAAFAAPGLPRRFQGRELQLKEELLGRADAMVITAPEADQGGPLAADRVLLGRNAEPLPPLPAGSRLESSVGAAYRAVFQRLDLGVPTAEFLRRYAICAFKAWGEQELIRHERSAQPQPAHVLLSELLGQEPERPWWRLKRALLAQSALDEERLEQLGRDYPEAEPWLHRHRELLTGLNYEVRLLGGDPPVEAWIDAGRREPLGVSGRNVAKIYRFVAPLAEADPAAGAGAGPESEPGAAGATMDWRAARDVLNERWSEYFAAHVMLSHRTAAPDLVELYVWPLLGEPVKVESSDRAIVQGKIDHRRRLVSETLERFRQGDLSPTPGQQCATCQVFDICREGRPA